METGKGTRNGDGGLCLYWLRILEVVRWVLILSAASVRKADAMGKCVRMATNIGRPETKSVGQEHKSRPSFGFGPEGRYYRLSLAGLLVQLGRFNGLFCV